MRYLFMIMFASSLLLAACGGGNNTPVAAGDLDLAGFTALDINGGGQLVTKPAGSGMSEQGTLINGKKNGNWMTFYDEGTIKTIQSFVNGVPNGISLELSNRGQIEKRTGYLNNKLHGASITYKYGRPLTMLNYDQGVLNGDFEEYNDRGKIKKRGFFKNGKQHGKLEFFDDDENLVMEYQYDMGEKVSGGIIEKKAEAPAEQ